MKLIQRKTPWVIINLFFVGPSREKRLREADAIDNQKVFAFPPDLNKSRGITTCGTYHYRRGKRVICRRLGGHSHGENLPILADLKAAGKEYILDEIFKESS